MPLSHVEIATMTIRDCSMVLFEATSCYFRVTRSVSCLLLYVALWASVSLVIGMEIPGLFEFCAPLRRAFLASSR
jgi:hypothetical protein